MALIYVKGDLLASDCDVIAHGCNCFCKMGAGIARQIAEKFPEAAAADSRSYPGDRSKLGSYTIAQSGEKRIYNLYTQYNYGRSGVYVSYDAVASAIKAMISDLKTSKLWETRKIGVPLIGAGLAGGDWTVIEKILSDAFSDKDLYVYSL